MLLWSSPFHHPIECGRLSDAWPLKGCHPRQQRNSASNACASAAPEVTVDSPKEGRAGESRLFANFMLTCFQVATLAWRHAAMAFLMRKPHMAQDQNSSAPLEMWDPEPNHLLAFIGRMCPISD